MNNQPLTAEQIRIKYTQKITGNDYLKVAGRILLFRMDYRNAALTTEPIQFDSDYAIFRAAIAIDGVTVATGHARVTAQQAKNAGGRFMQMAETVAMGRALANFGYGTEELADDDNEELADSPVTPLSADQMQQAISREISHQEDDAARQKLQDARNTTPDRATFDAAINAELLKHSAKQPERAKIFQEATGYKTRDQAWDNHETAEALIKLISSYMQK